MEENHCWIPWASDFIWVGGTMKKLKGLWFIGIGLLVLGLWVYVIWYLYNAFTYVPPKTPFLQVLGPVLRDAFVGMFSNINIWSVWPITGFALVAIGIFRLAASLLPEEDTDD
jgi:hypothetical protein